MHKNHQRPARGFALVTAMLLMLIMVILGVSMYGGVNLQEKVSVNTRIKNQTLLAADSSIQARWTQGTLQKKMLGELEPEAIGGEFTDAGDALSLSGKASICYLGEDEFSPGSYTSSDIASNSGVVWKQQKFFAAAFVEEQATGAITTVEQGGFMLLPDFDGPPNCNREIIEKTLLTGGGGELEKEEF